MNPTPSSPSGTRRPTGPAFRRILIRWLGLAVPAALALSAGPAATAADLFERLPDLPSDATTSVLSSWGDYDNDGDVDLVVANGGGAKVQTIDLYRNRGDGTFDRLTADEAGALVSELGSWESVAWADFDRDGSLDVVATASTFGGGTAREPCIFRNRGDGKFTLVAAGDFNYATVAEDLWIDPPTDLNGDGFADILAPTASAAGPHVLFMNRGDGGFARDRDSVVVRDRLSPNLDSFADFDNDGDLDVFVPDVTTGTSHRDRLYVNDGLGHFTIVTNLPFLDTSGFTWHGSWADYDNDGDFDILLHKGGGPRFFRNDGGTFTEADIGPTGTQGSGFWNDYDNDGYLDLFIERATAGGSSLLRNGGDGKLELVEGALTSLSAPAQFSNWGDFDNDGFMDLVYTLSTGGTQMYRNRANANRWLKLRLVGTASDTVGLGALVRVRATIGGRSVEQMQHVGGSLPSQQDLRPNFGLGDAMRADEVRIRWPSGNVQVLTNVAANQVLTVTEPSSFRPIHPVTTLNGSIGVVDGAGASVRQWYFQGVELAGQTNSTLRLTNGATAQAGRYTVVAETVLGPRTNHVQVRVLEQFTKILEGEVVNDRYGSATASWFDGDGDGDLDLFVANSSSPEVPVSDNYYVNQGNDTFVKVVDDPIVATAAISIFGLAADFDNDGDPDLFTNMDKATGTDGGDQLFLNDGKGHFTRLLGQPFDGPRAGSAFAAAADLDLDGDIDLVASRSLWEQTRTNVIYWNEGDATFTAATAEEVGGPLLYLPKTLGMTACFDYDGDGAPDLLFQEIRFGARLFRNNRDRTFSEVTKPLFGATPPNWLAVPADYDNDGLTDLLMTDAGFGATTLFRNRGDGTYDNVTAASGLRPPGSIDWPAATWVDYDNDGYLDVAFASYSTNGLYRNRGDGTFHSVNVGNLHTDGDRAYVAVWGDYDGNGFADLYLVCGDALPRPNHLYRNNGNGNHWLKVRLVGTTSNRDGLGAKVRAKATIGRHVVTQTRELISQAIGADRIAHFGLGNATRATKVRIEWPSGIVQELANVAADQVLTVTEPAAIRLTTFRVTDGVRIEWRGEPNGAYDLESTTAWKSWSSQSVTADATGAASITLPANTGATFHRVVKR